MARSIPPDSQDLRRRVLDASIALIAQEGLSALSLREVARRAGVSHQAPYHYFQDRHAILAAIAQEGFLELGRRLRGSQVGPRTRGERFAAAGRAYVHFAMAFPAHFRIMFRPELVQLAAFPEAKAAANAAFQELEALVTANAGPLGTSKGTTMGASPELVSLAWSLAHGLASLLLDGPLVYKLPAAAEREEHIAAVMGLAARLVESTSTSAKRSQPSDEGRESPKTGKKSAKKRSPAKRS